MVYFEDSNEAIFKEEDKYYDDFLPLQLALDQCIKPILGRLQEIEEYDIIEDIID